MAQKPTAHEIRAVQSVLYKQGRLEKISELVNNVVVLMNLDPSANIPSSDSRYPAGSGPQWYLPSDGSLAPSVTEAVGYCDQLVTLIGAMRQEISKLSFPQADKRHLLTALSENAMVWTTRANLWRAAAPPADSNAAAASIAEHMTASANASKHLRPYLKSAQDLGLQ